MPAVTLSFSGFMSKFNWYGLEDDSGFFLIDGDWNDYTVLVETVRTIKLDTTVTYHSEMGEATVDELKSAAVVLGRHHY